MALKFLIGGALQGSNDAFVEGEIPTGLGVNTRTAFRIRTIEWFLPSMPGVDNQVEAILRRNSAAAIAWNSPAMIAGIRRVADFTTSGAFNYEAFPNRQLYPKDLELLIVEETLYIDADSNGTSASNQFYCRIGVETRNITENERLQILAATAGSS